VNPADQSVIGHVPMLERAQIVVRSTPRSAFGTWRWTPQAARSAALLRWHALILRHLDDLAALLSLEQGKPLAEARGEIRYAASFVEWFANEAKRAAGRTIPTHIDGAHLGTVMEPVGVAALITPWNFPRR
jgi:aspartate-semialdehyde dehydrogenase